MTLDVRVQAAACALVMRRLFVVRSKSAPRGSDRARQRGSGFDPKAVIESTEKANIPNKVTRASCQCEEGVGYMGQEFITLPLNVRRQVREDLRRDFEGLGSPGGPIALPLEVTFGSGRKYRRA